MFKLNIRHFFRSLVTRRFYFAMTLIGTSLGLCAVLLAFVYISDEGDFDQFHSKTDRIFRVNKFVKEENGKTNKDAESPGLMARALEADFPEVELATHIAPWFDEVLVGYEDRNAYVEHWIFADTNFFEIFDFELERVENPKAVLGSPGQVLITPELAQNLFGNEDPIGKVLKGIQDKEFMVGGIVKPAPRNSHIQFDVLASWASTESQSNILNFSFMNNWLGQTVYTYLLLNRPDQSASIDEKLPDFTKKYMENRADVYSFFLQPFEDIYLQSADLMHLRGGKYGSSAFLKMFAVIALLILLIACFNYINISTAQSLQRAKEVGVKKILGATKKALITQFLTETLMITLVSGILALAAAHILLPHLNQWFVKDIPDGALYSIQSLGFLMAIIFLTSFIAGIFPGIFLTKFRPISNIRGLHQFSPGGELPRQVLISCQLIISIALIAGTLLLFRQFKYVLNKDLGFEKDQILVMNAAPGIQSNHEAFGNELRSIPGVVSVSICNAVVGEGTFGSTVIPEGNNGEEMMVQVFRVDSNYLKTFGMEMADGRFFGQVSDQSQFSFVVNEAFVRQMAWESPLEKTIQFVGTETRFPVVGILRDFHFNTLHQEVTPLIMYLDQRNSNISIRFDPDQLSVLLPELESLWNQFEQRFPFEYYFLDDFFAEKYLAEKKMIRIIALFSIIAIFIACLGLYGLASFAITRRVKEIGIRKVLGATVPSIVGLLSMDFVKLVVLSFFLATPIIYYFSNRFLDDFAYRIDVSVWTYILAGAIALGIVILTVGSHSLKASMVNPVESLKSNQ